MQDIAEAWTHPVDPEIPLFFNMGWDWRRDLWEQSERIGRHVAMIRNTTDCRPILVGHSNGGRLIYVGLGRFGAELADEIAGVLYAAPNMLPNAGVAPGAFALPLSVACRSQPRGPCFPITSGRFLSAARLHPALLCSSIGRYPVATVTGTIQKVVLRIFLKTTKSPATGNVRAWCLLLPRATCSVAGEVPSTARQQSDKSSHATPRKQACFP